MLKKVLIYLVTMSKSNKSLIRTDLPVTIPLSVLMALAAEAHVAESELRRIK